MSSRFTIEEHNEAQRIIGYDPKKKSGWWITGESGAANLMFRCRDGLTIYICWLRDFEHFKQLWELLNQKPSNQ